MSANKSKAPAEFNCDKCGSECSIVFYAGVGWLLCPQCRVGTFWDSYFLHVTRSEADRIAVVEAMQGYTLIGLGDDSEMEPPTLSTQEWDPEDLEVLRAELARRAGRWRAPEKPYTIECTNQEARNGLALYFRAIARFGRKHAGKSSDNLRVAKNAEALEQVAAYCLTLADEDHLLARLFAMPACFVQGGYFVPPFIGELSQCDEVADRCGFDGDIHPATWLSDWIDAIESDYPQWRQPLSECIGVDQTEKEIE